jgi:polygalacturonase
VLNHCQRVLVQGITLTNSPSFHLVPRECRDVMIDSVQFKAPAKAPNTDGLDPSGWNYLITNCRFDVGDDCIAIKPSGQGEADHLSCEDFTISDCTFMHGHGMSIGGQTPGGLRHMVVRDCSFDSTDAGIRMKADRGSGGLVEDLLYENLKMNNVKVPILITSYYPKIPKDPGADPAQPVTGKTPIWRHIRINNVTSQNSPVAGRIIGLPEMLVEDVVLTNVHISADKGFEIVHAKGIRFENSSITAAQGPAIEKSDAEVSGLAGEP